MNKDSFKLYMCKETQADKFITDVLIIDSASKDTIRAPHLLDSNFVRIGYSGDYNILLIGEKRWNYLINFEIIKTYRVSDISFCFERKAHHTRYKRKTDFAIRDGVEVINGWSKKISKKTGKEVKCFGSKWYTSFRTCWCK